MESPKGTTAIIFVRFTIFYTIPIVLVLFLMKVVFGTPLGISIIAAVWDFFVMTLLFFLLHSIFRFRFREKRPKLSPLMALERIPSTGNTKEIIEKLKAKAARIKGFRLIDRVSTGEYIVGITGITINSLGELIRIRLVEGTNLIEVASRPAFNAGFGDGGKNRRNVERIISAIR